MNKKSSKIMAIFLCCILLIVTFSGCINEEQKSEKSKEATLPPIKLDQPSILPDWKDGEYHDYYDTIQVLNFYDEQYPDLVNIFSIGKSVLGKDILCIKITNENNKKEKFSCLISGCIHGIEWEAGEACLYFAEYLLINYKTNKTIKEILNNTEVYIIPLVNPDGRQNNEHGNDNGIDLNRNFDVFFGRLRSRCVRLGKLFGRIKMSYIKIPFVDPGTGWLRNCGRYAFSEPESKSLRDFMESLKNQKFSFYVDCHTAWHNIMTPVPWSKWILNPPFIISTQEKELFDYVKNWVEINTEYEADKTETNNIGGCTDIWVFYKYRIPSFVFEILSLEYDAWQGEEKHDNLVHWMKTTLPVFMYLLVNIENLYNWEIPDIQPSLPEGVPPEPLK